MSYSPLLEVAQQEYFFTVVVRTCISFSLCCFVADVLLDWGGFVASLHACKVAVKSMFSPCQFTSFERRRSRDFNKTRLARMVYALDLALLPFSALFMMLVICMYTVSPSNIGLAFRAVFMCGRHFATFYWGYLKRRYGSYPVGGECIFKVVMLGIACRGYFADTHSFLMYGGLWSALRVIIALLALDCSMSVRWNIYFSAVMCLSVWDRRGQLRIDGQSSMAAFFHHFMIELVTCVLVCAASVFLGVCDKDILNASRESSLHLACQRLLAVFCDAQLHICPRCGIISHSPHLVNLLGAEDGTRDMRSTDRRSTLHGRNFLQYVGESDQQRFQDFISATAGLQSEDSAADDPILGECARRPAASIQVNLCTEGSANPIPVELFLICLDDAIDAPELLVGIRETCEALPREACTDAPGVVALQQLAATAPAREPGPEAGAPAGAPPASDPRRPPGAAPALAREQPHRHPAEPGAASQPPVQHAGLGLRSSLASSSRASSSSGSCAPDEGCVSSICLRLDSASSGLPVEDMCLRFGDSGRAPRLEEWLPREALDVIHRTVQELVNQEEYRDGEEVTASVGLGALRFSRSGATFLRAECAALAVEGPVIGPRDSDEDSDDFNTIVQMQLTGVSKFRMPWQSGPQRLSGRLPLIHESPTEAAGDGCASAPLRHRNSGLQRIARGERPQRCGERVRG
ncbi:unnamed protein product [Prorocentrum cordatum]|uniref:Uncharacterized protein n=1 Tax=Prorocentrum cordatum TaxID=2364126 RepID=A0ABN9P6E2_9DINO|nr:unnamed protein product [Polarella glacialis]